MYLCSFNATATLIVHSIFKIKKLNFLGKKFVLSIKQRIFATKRKLHHEYLNYPYFLLVAHR